MILYDIPAWIMLSWLFVLGAVLGSFLNVCVHRIPRHDRLADQIRGLWHPPSRCPGCLTPILLRDNIPILGWLLLRGRCRSCRTRISWRYPLIELLNGLLFVLIYWHEIPFGYAAHAADTPLHTGFGLSGSTFWSPEAVLHWRYAFHMVMIEALLVASLIDLDEMIIPDGSTVPAMLFALVVGAAIPQVRPIPVWFSNPALVRSYLIIFPERWQAWFVDRAAPYPPEGIVVPEWIARHPHWHGLVAGLVGLAIGGGVVWGVRVLGSWVLRREAMGFGDVVLMAMVGAFLGWQATVAVFFLAPVIALGVVAARWLSRWRHEIPYGPYLSLGALAMLLLWPRLWPTIERLCQMGPFIPLIAVIMAVLLVVCLHLTQGVKWILGIPLYPAQSPDGVWTSADTLTYLARENDDPNQGNWRREAWPGAAAGRGQSQGEGWRRGAPGELHGARHRFTTRPG